jgi:signal transduction histidine kinase
MSICSSNIWFADEMLVVAITIKTRQFYYFRVKLSFNDKHKRSQINDKLFQTKDMRMRNTITNPLGLDINPLSLHFRDKRLESEFTADYKTKNVTLVTLFTLLSSMLFGLFYLIYNMEHPAWFIVMIVLSVVVGLTVYFRLVQKKLNFALFSYSLIVELSYNHRMLYYDGSDIVTLVEYFMGLSLIILAVNSFIRLKFVYAVFLNSIFFLAFISYSMLGVGIQYINLEYFTYSTIVFFATIVVILISIYNNEYMYRYAFVQHKIIGQQANELRDAKENTEQKVIERTAELELERNRSLKAILEGQQIERQRIAQDLHDSLNIQLIGLRRKLESGTDQKNEVLLGDIDLIISHVREVSHKITFSKIDIDEKLRWDIVTETELFKIIQELVTNIIKHAQARNVLIELIADEKMLYLTVEDDGIGFDLTDNASHRFGLNNIEARLSILGGTVSFDSQTGRGTTVMINVPIA